MVYEPEDFYDTPERYYAEDTYHINAIEDLENFFDENSNDVFFSRQIEIQKEDIYFHWITNRAIRELVDKGRIKTERRALKTGGNIHLMWHRNYRYYRRKAKEAIDLVEEYTDPNIGAALGLHAEMMVLEGFARLQFVMNGRNVRKFSGKEWKKSDHELDFIFERDGLAYGVEVKNKLGYMDYEELKTKVGLCKHLGIRPIFVVRMIPKSWVYEVSLAGGFALILKYQLYPWTHRDLAKKIAEKLKIPVDAPRSISEGTMERFLKWHMKNM
jgi:hypothetical protein